MNIKRLIAAFLMGAVIMTSINISFAAENPVIEIGTVAAYKESVVTLPMSIRNNPGIVSMYLEVSYDTSRLELIEVFDQGLLKDPSFGNNFTSVPVAINWDGSVLSQNITQDGTVAMLQFQVLDDAPIGFAEVTVSYGQNGILNRDLQSLSFDVKSGGISVSDNTNSQIIVQPGTSTITVPADVETIKAIIKLINEKEEVTYIGVEK